MTQRTCADTIADIMASYIPESLVKTIFASPVGFIQAVAEWQGFERRKRASWERCAADHYVNYGMLDWGESLQHHDDDDEWWNE